mgnify:CR=1 FL=1
MLPVIPDDEGATFLCPSDFPLTLLYRELPDTLCDQVPVHPVLRLS